MEIRRYWPGDAACCAVSWRGPINCACPSWIGCSAGRRRRYGHGDVADDLRNRHPLRHAFAAGEVGHRDVALRHVALQFRKRVGSVFVEPTLNVIFHLPRLYQLNCKPVLSLSTMQISTMAQIHEATAR